MLRLPVDDTGAVLSQETGTSTTALYRNLSQAESDAYIDLAARVPWALRGAPRLLTSSDGGYTYPFTDGNSTAITPTGHLGIFVNTTDIPNSPLVEGVDYSIEGTIIRITNGQTWRFATGPYTQLINDPVALSASGSPTLPAPARLLIVYRAAAMFARGGGKRDWRVYDDLYDEELKAICLMYHTQVQRQGSGGQYPTLTRERLLGGRV